MGVSEEWRQFELRRENCGGRDSERERVDLERHYYPMYDYTVGLSLHCGQP